MFPREGYLKVVKRILSYLNTFPNGSVIIDISYPDHSFYSNEYHSNWMEFYSEVRMNVYVDADHAHDLVTIRSITGILLKLNNTHII
jgi:hypothetical protein